MFDVGPGRRNFRIGQQVPIVGIGQVQAVDNRQRHFLLVAGIQITICQGAGGGFTLGSRGNFQAGQVQGGRGQ